MMRYLPLLFVLACGSPPSPQNVTACRALEGTMQGVAHCLVDRYGWDEQTAIDTAWRAARSDPQTVDQEVACATREARFTAAVMRNCLVQNFSWPPQAADSSAGYWDRINPKAH